MVKVFNVNSRKIISLISRRSLKYSKTRNIIATAAIILTAVMFTTLFTVGSSFIDSSQRSTMRQVGTSSHAGFKFLTQEQYDILKEDPKIKDISYDIIIGFGENPELKKTYVEIRWTEEKAADWSFNLPTTGTLPKNRLDIATTTAVLDAFGLPHELGVEVPLEFTANGMKHKENFTLCGLWETDVVMGANGAFLSREYSDEVAPVITELTDTPDNDYAGYINPSLWFSSSWNIDKQMQDLKERCGFDANVNDGVNWAYASAEVDAISILLIAGILSLIILSGYLIIYNIFYISVSKDIRFYGLLKTIGMTNVQLRRIVRKQALFLCVLGVPLGLAFGYLCAYMVVPTVIETTSLANDYVISHNPIIFIIAGIFTVLTVWISCIRPCRLVSKISPVEAVRYTENANTKQKKAKKTKHVNPFSMAWENIKRTPKKTIAVILSLSLSMVLLNVTVTFVKGFDMDKYLENSVVSDFYITDASLTNSYSASTTLNAIDPETMDEIKNLDGITNLGSVYMSESQHTLNETGIENAKKIVEEYGDKIPMPYAEEAKRQLIEENTLASHIYGVDEFVTSKMEIDEGKMDLEKLKSGNYVIASAFTSDGKGHYYDVGDKVTIDFGDGKSKEYEVLAIGSIAFALGPQHGHFFDISFTMDHNEFVTQTGETGIMKTAFDVEPSEYEKAEEWIENYCEKVRPDLDFKSRTTYVNEFKGMQNMYLIVGGILSFILALIGILNFINSIITSVQARRKELAVLQAIGMTGRQLKKMLVGEGLCYSLITILVTLTLGNLITYGLVLALANQMWFFTYHFIITPLLICTPFLILLSVIIPIISYRNICRKSIVDRLREVE